MGCNADHPNESYWVSLLLRVAIASLLLVAGIHKFVGGLEGVVAYFQSKFAETWLPMFLVTMHARIVPFAEIILGVWLLVGYRLKLAWIVTSFFMISLALGMVVAKEYGSAAHNYFYVLMTCVGLHFSHFDRLHLGASKE